MICLNIFFCILNKLFNANLTQPYCVILKFYSLLHTRLVIEKFFVSFFDIYCIIAIKIMALKASDLKKLSGNSDVKKHLTTVFSETISGALKLFIRKKFSEFKKEFHQKLDDCIATVNLLQTQLNNRNLEIDNLCREKAILFDQLELVNHHISNLDQYSRQDNLIVSGFPMAVADVASVGVAESSNKLLTQFVRLCKNDLHCEIEPSDISTNHRLPSKPGKPSLTIVRSARLLVKQRVYFARFQLKVANSTRDASSRIYINEDIVENGEKIFAVARDNLKIKRISGVWMRNCKVIIRKLDCTTQTLSTLDEATRPNL